MERIATLLHEILYSPKQGWQVDFPPAPRVLLHRASQIMGAGVDPAPPSRTRRDRGLGLKNHAARHDRIRAVPQLPDFFPLGSADLTVARDAGAEEIRPDLQSAAVAAVVPRRNSPVSRFISDLPGRNEPVGDRCGRAGRRRPRCAAAFVAAAAERKRPRLKGHRRGRRRLGLSIDGLRRRLHRSRRRSRRGCPRSWGGPR